MGRYWRTTASMEKHIKTADTHSDHDSDTICNHPAITISSHLSFSENTQTYHCQTIQHVTSNCPTSCLRPDSQSRLNFHYLTRKPPGRPKNQPTLDVQQSAIKYYHSSTSVNKPVPACFVSRQCWSCRGREPEHSHTDRQPRPRSPGRIVSNAPALSGTAAGELQHCRR